jgi:hypothetical protein
MTSRLSDWNQPQEEALIATSNNPSYARQGELAELTNGTDTSMSPSSSAWDTSSSSMSLLNAPPPDTYLLPPPTNDDDASLVPSPGRTEMQSALEMLAASDEYDEELESRTMVGVDVIHAIEVGKEKEVNEKNEMNKKNTFPVRQESRQARSATMDLLNGQIIDPASVGTKRSTMDLLFGQPIPEKEATQVITQEQMAASTQQIGNEITTLPESDGSNMLSVTNVLLVATHKCSMCDTEKNKTEYSGSQWKKNRKKGTAKCKTCASAGVPQDTTH